MADKADQVARYRQATKALEAARSAQAHAMHIGQTARLNVWFKGWGDERVCVRISERYPEPEDENGGILFNFAEIEPLIALLRPLIPKEAPDAG